MREIRRNEQHDAFINAVTHELKTPVASIRLYLETLQRRELPEDKRREFYGVMLADSDRLLDLIEQVLRAGRTSARARVSHQVRDRSARHGPRVPRPGAHAASPARRGACVRRIASRESAAGDRYGGSRRIEGGGLEPARQRDQVLRQRRPRARSNSTPVDERAWPSACATQGIGISAAELKRIFRRFYRIPEAVAMRVKGTGLGLFIVSSVARKHGGRVFAESAGAGQGSTFTLQLPMAPPA